MHRAAFITLLVASLAAAANGGLIEKNQLLVAEIEKFQQVGEKVSDALGQVDNTITQSETMTSAAEDAKSTVKIMKSCFSIASKIPIGFSKLFKAPATFFKLADSGAKKFVTFLQKSDRTLGKASGIVGTLDGVVMSAPEMILPLTGFVSELAPLITSMHTCMERTNPSDPATIKLGNFIRMLENAMDKVKDAIKTLMRSLEPLVGKISKALRPITKTLDTIEEKLEMITDIASPFDGFADIMTKKVGFPWIKTYGRGVGRSPDCPAGKVNDAGLCYPKCRSGYKGVGPVCWQSCNGFGRDDGAFCAKRGSYGRGAGRSPCTGCSGCSGCSWRGCSGCSGCSSCSTKHCRSSEDRNGALCYPKCRSGYKNVGCCTCSPRCPSGMTDIGVSCAKKSYGRGVGKVPLTCRADEDLWGLLCYPKCREGYKNRACCVCEKPIRIEFTLEDVVDGIGKVLGALYDIPIIGDLLKLVDKAIEKLLKPIMDAIMPMPDLNLPSLNVGLDLENIVPFRDTYNNIMSTITEQISTVKAVASDLMESLPAELPSSCPEIVDPLVDMAKLYVLGKSASAFVMPRTPKTKPMDILMNFVNENRACATTQGHMLSEITAKLGVKTVQAVMLSDGKKKATTSKKEERKSAQRDMLLAKAGLSSTEPQLIQFSSSSCRAGTSKRRFLESNATSHRKLMKTKLKFALQQTVLFMTSPDTEKKIDEVFPRGAKLGTTIGYFVQRMDLTPKDGKVVAPKECIWPIKTGADGSVGVSTWGKRGDVEEAGFDASLESAEFHPADLRLSGFYFVPEKAFALGGQNTVKFKIGDFSDCPEPKTSCSGRKCEEVRCPETAGCRISGTPMIQKRVDDALKHNSWIKETYNKGTNVFLHEVEDRKRQGKAAYYSFDEIDVVVPGESDPLKLTLTFGPNTAKNKFQVLNKKDNFQNVKAHMNIVKQRTKSALERVYSRLDVAIDFLRKLTSGEAIPVVTETIRRLFLFSFGVDLSVERKFPLYSSGFPGGEGASYITTILGNFLSIKEVLEGKRDGHLVFGDVPKTQDNILGYVQSALQGNSFGKKGQIRLLFFANDCLDKKGKPVNTLACQDWYSQLIAHEGSHAAVGTNDHIYFNHGEGTLKHALEFDGTQYEKAAAEAKCKHHEGAFSVFFNKMTRDHGHKTKIHTEGSLSHKLVNDLDAFEEKRAHVCRHIDDEVSYTQKGLSYTPKGVENTETKITSNFREMIGDSSAIAYCCNTGGIKEWENNAFEMFLGQLKQNDHINEDTPKPHIAFGNRGAEGENRFVMNADSYGTFLFPERMVIEFEEETNPTKDYPAPGKLGNEMLQIAFTEIRRFYNEHK